MPTEKIHIENIDEEIEIEIDFDYQPEEQMTRHYPGCSASADINEVLRVDNGSELCLLPKAEELIEETLLEIALDNQVEMAHYKKYGYLLTDY